MDGVLASGCDLYLGDGVAQIESVMTLERFRNRGLGRAVTLCAAAAAARDAGAELVFLVAEADDWPRELYRKLGFDEIGRTHGFMRRPS